MKLDLCRRFVLQHQLPCAAIILMVAALSSFPVPTVVMGVELETARLSLAINYFDNEKGTMQNGAHCPGGCDPTVSVRATLHSFGDIFFDRQGDYSTSMQSVMYDDYIGDPVRGQFKNPISIKLPKAVLQNGKVRITILVEDVDAHGPRQTIDEFNFDAKVEIPFYDEMLLLRRPGNVGGYSVMSVSYSVLCYDLHVFGKMCDKYCLAQNTDSGGHYSCTPNGEKTCLPGWTEPDKDCKVPSRCSAGPCQNGGTCVDLFSSKDYWCVCTADFMGKNCQLGRNPCKSTDCLNGATCLNLGSGKFRCTCPPGYQGDRCQTDVDRCKVFSPCPGGSTCYTLTQGFSCACAPGFSGINCQNKTDVCSQGENPCGNGGTCVNQPPGSFSCRCPPGLRGRLCEQDVDECQASPPPCRPGYQCVNTVGGHHCILLDRDECAGVVCGGEGVCIDLPYKYYCQCPAGFSGVSCNYSVSHDLLSKLQEAPDGGSAREASWSVIVVAVSTAIAAQLAAETVWPGGL